MKDYRLVIRD